MISNNMIRLAASAHQDELHRAAADAQRSRTHSSDAETPSSHRLQCVVARMLLSTAARRAQARTVIPRISI
jgi:hypothetical protein